MTMPTFHLSRVVKRDLVVFRATKVNHGSSYPGTDSTFGPGLCEQRDVTILWEALQVSASEEDRLKKKKRAKPL